MTNSQTELGNQGRPWPRIHLLVTVCSTPGLAAQLASKDGRHIAQEGLRSRSRMGESFEYWGPKHHFVPGRESTKT